MRSITSSFILAFLICTSVLASSPVSAKSSAATVQVTIADTAPFPNRLVASRSPSRDDFNKLRSMIDDYRGAVPPENLAIIERYLSSNAQSPWRLALQVNLGALYYEGGYFAKAIDAYGNAWHADGQKVTSETRPLRDAAIGELARMHARLGHADELQKMFDEIGDAALYGSASEAIAGAREGLWQMRNNQGIAYRCGPAALSSIVESSRDGTGSSTPAIERVSDEALIHLRDYPSGVDGVSMDQVTTLAHGAQMGLVAAKRSGEAPIPLPAVVHWKVNHYAALVAERNGLYHVKDSTFGRDLWITKDAIDSESSGIFLIPENKALVEAGWTKVSTAETSKLYGRGYVSTGDQADTRSDSNMDDDNSCPRGMCVPNVASMLVSLTLKDVPVGYQPPKGPSVFTMVTYNQREASQPATLNFFNIGPKWSLNWLSYIEDSPTSIGSSTRRFAAGGGAVDYSGYNSTTGAFSREERNGAQLVVTATAPIAYERRLPDGGKEVYSSSNGATAYPRRVFLTRIVDAYGNALTLSYDASMRLTQITDAIGQVTAVSYQHATNPMLVTRVTDPFGRYASFDYDLSGRLSKITDTIGISSEFAYDSATFITAMTTPYGTTSFAATTSSTKRSINITDPMGYTRRTEFIDQSPGFPFSEPTPAGISTFQYLYYRNTHHWDGEAYARSPGDYSKTHVKHWLHGKTTSMLAGVVESTKNPLETRVWNYYPGQISPGYNAGTTLDLPAKTARLLPDGVTTQLVSQTYTAAGNSSGEIDAVGRETQSTYDSTGVDLLNVKRKVGTAYETIGSYSYNSQHQPLTYTDQSGQTWTMTYNSAGQLLTVTNPKGETTTRVYNGSGYLTTITNANSQTAASFTYDAVGRVATETDAGGYTKTYGYDNLDRLVTTTYPDGTTTVNSWTALDLTAVKDRLGRVTRYEYNANRKLVKITDPAGLVTRYGYDRANRLISLTDPNLKVTQWERDIQGRVTAKFFPDLSRTQIAYDTAGRVASVTDTLGQARQYAYAKDDMLLGVAYANAVNPTPSVTYSWDSYFPRMASMVDGIGTTTYSYQASGTLGAGRLASEAGQFGAASTVMYGYDALGRVLTRTVGSSIETFEYDALGRRVSDVNALGTFRYTYLGQTAQVTDQTVDGGSYKVSYTYESNAGDRQLKRLNNRNASNPLAARDYYYKTDAEGRITAETPAASLAMTFEYDDSDRLTSDKRSVLTRDDYAYDDAGNLIYQKKGADIWEAAANGNNQLTTADAVAWSYDAAGNLLNDGKRSYVWDAQHRMVQIRNLVTGSVSDIGYDGIGRRIVMKERASQGATSVESRYLWCGEEICQRRDSANMVQALYFMQGEIKNGTSLFYARDQLGSIRNVANKDGAWQGTLNYTAYGEIKQQSGSLLPDRQYAGMFQHAPSGLNLTWYRAYDPGAGRWLSRDPIGELGGDNLYSYVGGNPITWTDPFGLQAWQPGMQPPGNVPGGPWSPAGPGQRQGSFFGPKPPSGPRSRPGQRQGSFFGPKPPSGPRSMCTYVPDAKNGGPSSAPDAYWKTKAPGQEWQRYDLNGDPKSPEEVHPGNPEPNPEPEPPSIPRWTIWGIGIFFGIYSPPAY